jgi:hypothetical protein
VLQERNVPSHCATARGTTGVVETKMAPKDRIAKETFILTRKAELKGQ